MERAALPMVQQTEDLLADAEPSLADVEETLTQGYAEALALEAERLRATDELVTLATRVTRADVELGKLRAMLDRLQARTRALRRPS